MKKLIENETSTKNTHQDEEWNVNDFHSYDSEEDNPIEPKKKKTEKNFGKLLFSRGGGPVVRNYDDLDCPESLVHKTYTFFNEQTGVLETITVTTTTPDDTKVISKNVATKVDRQNVHLGDIDVDLTNAATTLDEQDALAAYYVENDTCLNNLMWVFKSSFRCIKYCCISTEDCFNFEGELAQLRETQAKQSKADKKTRKTELFLESELAKRKEARMRAFI